MEVSRTSQMKVRKAPRATSLKRPPDPESEAWNHLPWRKFEQQVFRIQKRMCAMRRIEISLDEPGGISRDVPKVNELT
jgi:hypothetical protein